MGGFFEEIGLDFIDDFFNKIGDIIGDIDDYFFHGGFEDDIKSIGRWIDDEIISPVYEFQKGFVNDFIDVIEQDPLHAMLYIAAVVAAPFTKGASLAALPYIHAYTTYQNTGDLGESFEAGIKVWATQQVMESDIVATATGDITSALSNAGVDPGFANYIATATTTGLSTGTLEVITGGSFSDGFEQGATQATAAAITAQIMGFLEGVLPDGFVYEGYERDTGGRVLGTNTSGQTVNAYDSDGKGGDNVGSPKAGVTPNKVLQNIPDVVSNIITSSVAAELRGEDVTSAMIYGAVARTYITTEAVSSMMEKIPGVDLDSEDGRLFLASLTPAIHNTVAQIGDLGLNEETGALAAGNLRGAIANYSSSQLFLTTLDFLDNSDFVQNAMNKVDTLRGNMGTYQDKTAVAVEKQGAVLVLQNEYNKIATGSEPLREKMEESGEMLRQTGARGALYMDSISQWNASFDEDGEVIPDSIATQGFTSFDDFFYTQLEVAGFDTNLSALNNVIDQYQRDSDAYSNYFKKNQTRLLELRDEFDGANESSAMYALNQANAERALAESSLMSDIEFLSDDIKANLTVNLEEDLVRMVAPSFNLNDYMTYYADQIGEYDNAFQHYLREGAKRNFFVSNGQKNAFIAQAKEKFRLAAANEIGLQKAQSDGATDFLDPRYSGVNIMASMGASELATFNSAVDSNWLAYAYNFENGFYTDFNEDLFKSVQFYDGQGQPTDEVTNRYARLTPPGFGDAANGVANTVADVAFLNELSEDPQSAIWDDQWGTEEILDILNNGGINIANGRPQYVTSLKDVGDNFFKMFNPLSGQNETIVEGISFTDYLKSDSLGAHEQLSILFSKWGDTLGAAGDEIARSQLINNEIDTFVRDGTITVMEGAFATASHFATEMVNAVIQDAVNDVNYAKEEVGALFDSENPYSLVNWSDEALAAKIDLFRKAGDNLVDTVKNRQGDQTIMALGVQGIAELGQSYLGLARFMGQNPEDLPAYQFAESLINNMEDYKSNEWKANAQAMQTALQSRGVDDPNTLANEAVWGTAEVIGGAMATAPLQFLGEILFREGIQEIVPLLVGGGLAYAGTSIARKQLGEQVGTIFGTSLGITGAALTDIAESAGGTAQGAYDEAYTTITQVMQARNLEGAGYTADQIRLTAERYAQEISIQNGYYAAMTTASLMFAAPTATLGFDKAVVGASLGRLQADAFETFGRRGLASMAAGETISEFAEEFAINNNLEIMLANWDPNRNVTGNNWFAGAMGAIVAGAITPVIGSLPSMANPEIASGDIEIPTFTQATGRNSFQSTGNTTADVLLLTSPDLASDVYTGTTDLTNTLVDLGVDYDVASSLGNAANDPLFTGSIPALPPSVAENNDIAVDLPSATPPDFSTFWDRGAYPTYGALFYDDVSDATYRYSSYDFDIIANDFDGTPGEVDIFSTATKWEFMGRGDNTLPDDYAQTMAESVLTEAQGENNYYRPDPAKAGNMYINPGDPGNESGEFAERNFPVGAFRNYFFTDKISGYDFVLNRQTGPGQNPDFGSPSGFTGEQYDDGHFTSNLHVWVDDAVSVEGLTQHPQWSTDGERIFSGALLNNGYVGSMFTPDERMKSYYGVPGESYSRVSVEDGVFYKDDLNTEYSYDNYSGSFQPMSTGRTRIFDENGDVRLTGQTLYGMEKTLNAYSWAVQRASRLLDRNYNRWMETGEQYGGLMSEGEYKAEFDDQVAMLEGLINNYNIVASLYLPRIEQIRKDLGLTNNDTYATLYEPEPVASGDFENLDQTMVDVKVQTNAMFLEDGGRPAFFYTNFGNTPGAAGAPIGDTGNYHEFFTTSADLYETIYGTTNVDYIADGRGDFVKKADWVKYEAPIGAEPVEPAPIGDPPVEPEAPEEIGYHPYLPPNALQPPIIPNDEVPAEFYDPVLNRITPGYYFTDGRKVTNEGIYYNWYGPSQGWVPADYDDPNSNMWTEVPAWRQDKYDTELAQYEADMAIYNPAFSQYEADLAQYNADMAQYNADMARYNAGTEVGEQDYLDYFRYRAVQDGWSVRDTNFYITKNRDNLLSDWRAADYAYQVFGKWNFEYDPVTGNPIDGTGGFQTVDPSPTLTSRSMKKLFMDTYNLTEDEYYAMMKSDLYGVTKAEIDSTIDNYLQNAGRVDENGDPVLDIFGNQLTGVQGNGEFVQNLVDNNVNTRDEVIQAYKDAYGEDYEPSTQEINRYLGADFTTSEVDGEVNDQFTGPSSRDISRIGVGETDATEQAGIIATVTAGLSQSELDALGDLNRFIDPNKTPYANTQIINQFINRQQSFANRLDLAKSEIRGAFQQPERESSYKVYSNKDNAWIEANFTDLLNVIDGRVDKKAEGTEIQDAVDAFKAAEKAKLTAKLSNPKYSAVVDELFRIGGTEADAEALQGIVNDFTNKYGYAPNPGDLFKLGHDVISVQYVRDGDMAADATATGPGVFTATYGDNSFSQQYNIYRRGYGGTIPTVDRYAPASAAFDTLRREFIDNYNYYPTDEELKSFIGDINAGVANPEISEQAQENIRNYMNPRQLSEAEAKAIITDYFAEDSQEYNDLLNQYMSQGEQRGLGADAQTTQEAALRADINSRIAAQEQEAERLQSVTEYERLATEFAKYGIDIYATEKASDLAATFYMQDLAGVEQAVLENYPDGTHADFLKRSRLVEYFEMNNIAVPSEQDLQNIMSQMAGTTKAELTDINQIQTLVNTFTGALEYTAGEAKTDLAAELGIDESLLPADFDTYIANLAAEGLTDAAAAGRIASDIAAAETDFGVYNKSQTELAKALDGTIADIPTYLEDKQYTRADAKADLAAELGIAVGDVDEATYGTYLDGLVDMTGATPDADGETQVQSDITGYQDILDQLSGTDYDTTNITAADLASYLGEGVNAATAASSYVTAEGLKTIARTNIESELAAVLDNPANFDGGAFDSTSPSGQDLIQYYAPKIESGERTKEWVTNQLITNSVPSRRYMADELAQDIKDELGLPAGTSLQDIINDPAYASLFTGPNKLVDEDGTTRNHLFQGNQEQALDDATVSQAEAEDYFRDTLGYGDGFIPSVAIGRDLVGVFDESDLATNAQAIADATTVEPDEVRAKLLANRSDYGIQSGQAGENYVNALSDEDLATLGLTGKYWQEVSALGGEANNTLAKKLEDNTTSGTDLRNYLATAGFDVGRGEGEVLLNPFTEGMSDALGFNTDLANTQSVIDYMDANEITGDEIRSQIVTETGVDIYEEDGVTLKAEFTDQALTNAGFLVDTKGRDGYQAANLAGNVADNTISESDIRTWLGNNDYAAPGAGADFSGYTGLGTDIAGQAGQYVTDEGLITQTQTTINNERQAVRDYFDTAHSYFDEDAAVNFDIDALRNADPATMQAAVDALVDDQTLDFDEIKAYFQTELGYDWVPSGALKQHLLNQAGNPNSPTPRQLTADELNELGQLDSVANIAGLPGQATLDNLIEQTTISPEEVRAYLKGQGDIGGRQIDVPYNAAAVDALTDEDLATLGLTGNYGWESLALAQRVLGPSNPANPLEHQGNHEGTGAFRTSGFYDNQNQTEDEARAYLASLGLTQATELNDPADPDSGYKVDFATINNLADNSLEGRFDAAELARRAALEGGYFDQNEVTFDEIREQIANELGVTPATLYDENGDPIAGYTDTEIAAAGFTQGVNVAETGLGTEITDNVLTRSDIENHLLGLGYSTEQIANFDSSGIAWNDTTALDELTATFQADNRNATQQAIAADLATNFGWLNATDDDIAAVADLDATGREAWVGDRRFTSAQADTALALQGITPESIGQARYDTLRNGLVVDQDRTGGVPATQAALVDNVEDPLLDPFFIDLGEVAAEFAKYDGYFKAPEDLLPFTGLIDDTGLPTTIETYVNENYVTADEARAALDGVAGVDAYAKDDQDNYIITDQQLLDAELTGQYVDTVENQALAGKVQNLTTDEAEARDLLIAQGVVNPSAADIQNYMGFTPEAPTFTPTDIADLRYRGILEQFGTPAVYSDTDTDLDGNPVLLTPATGIYAEIDSLRGQGLDAGAINTAISTYISGLGLPTSGDLSALQTEIQDYIGEQGFFTGDITDIQRIVSDVIGKPAELVTQEDIDYVTNLYQTNVALGPEADITYTPADLAYDVNNDGIINQTDIDTLNQLYAGQDAEYNQYVEGIDPSSQFADTGIFGTLAYDREQDRLADAQAEAERQAEIDRQNELQNEINRNTRYQLDASERERARQFAGQQQLLSSLAASQAQSQTQEPFIAEMGDRYDFSSIFRSPEIEAQRAAVTPYTGFRQRTAAEGGLITNETDELLALLEEIG